MTTQNEAPPYSVGDQVILTAISFRHIEGETYEDQGPDQMPGTVIRVWPNWRNITIRTSDGKTYVRAADSPSVVPA